MNLGEMAMARSQHREEHELLVTYEGPIHPSAVSDLLGTKSKRSWSLSLPTSGSDAGGSYVTRDDLFGTFSGKVGWPSSYFHVVTPKGKRYEGNLYPINSVRLEEDEGIYHQHEVTVAIHPRHSAIRGGKGGFGTLLKGQSKQAGAKQTLDFGACRDLSGRRLRHVNDEIKLRKWRELQAKRERGEDVDELEALKTPSGIRNWHLMVPNWSDGSSMSNKGRRKHERQLQREVRQLKRQKDQQHSERDQKRMQKEWEINEYVRRGEVEASRVAQGDDLKHDILLHLRSKRKLEKDETARESEAKAIRALNGNQKEPLVSEQADESFLLTLSGEMSLFDVTNASKKSADADGPFVTRLQSQSDFATAVVLMDPNKLKEVVAKGHGIYVEYQIQSAGLAQIGWIRRPESNSGTFLPNSDTGDGVGDDSESWGYDGSRGLKFHAGKEEPYGFGKDSNKLEWNVGDVLGSWCRIVPTDKSIEIGYSLNETDLGVAFKIDAVSSDEIAFYPALSLNMNEVVDVNTGPSFAQAMAKGCVGVGDLAKTDTNLHDSNFKEVEKTKSSACDAQVPEPKEPVNKRPREQAIEQNDVGPAETEPFDLNQVSSIEGLTSLGADRIKSILISMGIKCGGTLEDRANRLFSLKGLKRDEYPAKVRGKNFVL